MAKCPGSDHFAHFAAWEPDDKVVPPYPGAGVCVYCSKGVQFKLRPKPWTDPETGYTLGYLKSHKK